MLKFQVNEHQFELDREEIESLVQQMVGENIGLLDELNPMVKTAIKTALGTMLAKQQVRVPAGENIIPFAIKHYVAEVLNAVEDKNIAIKAKEVSLDGSK